MGTLGKAAVAASNAVAQVVEYKFTAGTTQATDVVAFSYGTTASSFVYGAANTNAATNFASALNTAAGATIAYVGTVDAAASAAASGSTILTLSAPNAAVKVGMSVTGTGIATGTTVTSVNGATVILSKATTAAVTTAATFGGGTANVSVIAPTAGTALKDLTFTDKTVAADLPSATTITANAAAVAASDAAQYSFASYTDVTSITANTVGGANVGAASTQAVTLTNTGAGATAVAGGLSQTVTTDGGAVTLSGSVGAISLTNTAQGADAISVKGGTSVTISAAGNAGGTVTVGSAAASAAAAPTGPSGAVSVSVASANASGGDVTVNGGTSVTVAESATRSGPSASSTTGSTATQGNVTVNGTAVTSSVTVSQTAAKAKVDYVPAKAAAYETVSVKFTALAAGEYVQVDGLRLTASATGSGMTAAQVAAAFANLAKGALNGAVSTDVGTFTGKLATSTNGGAAADDNFTSGSASGDTVVFTSATADAAAKLVILTDHATAPTATEVTKYQAAQVGVGNGGIANGAVTVTDVNYKSPTDGTAAQGTKLGVIGTVTANNFTSLTVNNSGLTTLNVTGGSGDVTLNDGSALVGASVLRSVTVNMGGQTGGALASGTSNYETLNLNMTAASSLANINMGGVTALNLGGSAALSASSLSGLSAVKTITLTGSAGLNGALTLANSSTAGVKYVADTASADLNALSSTLTSVDASASSGALKVSVSGSKTAVSGGAGADTITLVAAAGNTVVTKSISTGAGNDTVVLAEGTLSISNSITAGEGNDTLQMTAGSASNITASSALTGAVFKSYVTGFETLKIKGDTTAANTSASIDLAQLGFSTASKVNVAEAVVAAGTLTLDKFSNGGSLTISASQSGSGSAIALTNAVAWVATSANTPASYVDNSVNVVLAGLKADTYNTDGSYAGTTDLSIAGGNVSLSNVGTVNVTSSDAVGTSILGVATNTLTITDAKVAVVNVDGNANLTLTLGTGTAPATINGSAMTGALTVTAAAVTGGATVIGGSGKDALTASSGTGADKLSGGTGDDTLTSNAGSSVLTGGAGNDTFVVSTVSAAKTIYTTIADFSVGDTLKLGNVASNGIGGNGSAVVETFKSTKVDLSGLTSSATLGDAINSAIHSTAAGEIRWFQFDGNTYVLEASAAHSATGDFVDGADLVVKLSGLVDLSKAGFNADNQSLMLFG